MRLCFLFCFISLIQVSATSLAQKITLSKNNASLQETLDDIRVQTGYSILCDADVLSTAKPITVDLKNIPIDEALKQCLAYQPLTFVIKQKTIIISLKKETRDLKVAQIVITGTVLDERKTTLPGVTIKVKNTAIAAVTTANGTYRITVPNENAILVFSSIGYITQEVPVLKRNVVDVVLKEQNTGLNEIVVVGYGTSKVKDLTGSVGRVSMQDFAKAPVKSFDDALAGRLAGVQVSGNDGQPGQMNNIVIRGAGSITQDNSPLYVIDGFPLEDANSNSISPDDIASIDVLKDASATAIYGARGANGVIIITTKRGKKGAPVINYNGYYGTQKVMKTIPLMSPYEYVKYQLELNGPIATTRYLTTPGRTLDSYQNETGVDFQDLVLRQAPMQNHNISIRGGNDKTLFFISGNIIDQNGIIVNTGFKRYQGRISLDQTINEKFRIGINANYSNSITYGTIPSSDGSSNVSNSYLYSVWGYRPITTNENFDEINDFVDPDIDVLADHRVNPLISAQNELRRNINNTLIANTYLEYKVTPDLTLRITGGVTSNALRDESFYNSKTARGNPDRNVAGVNGAIYNTSRSNFLNENTVNYKKVFNKDHSFELLGGYTVQFNDSRLSGFSAASVPYENLGLDGLDQSLSITPSSGSTKWRLQSYLGRFNYSYKSKYLLTATMRADGSSKFADGKRWGYFPSASVAWRISEERFFKKISAINDAKIRLSYGQTGNNRIDDFAYLPQLTVPPSSSYSYNNGGPSLGATITAFGNPDLKWETTEQTNAGIDLSLFGQRVEFTADVYKKTTNDLLLNALLPYTTGLGSAFKNIGKMQNQGLEITVNTININSKHFKWNTGFNISFNANKVLALTENQTSLTTPVAFDNLWRALAPYISVIGQPIAQMYGAIWEGVYGYDDFNVTSTGKYVLKTGISNNGDPSANIQPGDIKYRDINHDGTINSDDFTIIGRALPLHTGGLSNNFNFMQFDLNIFLQWSYGNNIFNANKLIFEGNGKAVKELNQFATYANRWSPTNTTSTLFRTNGEGPSFYSSRLVEDGSYLRVKTISIGYNFSKTLLQKLKMSNARVYVSGQNLFTITGYSGIDPEVSVRNSTLSPGFDFSAYPRARTLTFGLNISL